MMPQTSSVCSGFFFLLILQLEECQIVQHGLKPEYQTEVKKKKKNMKPREICDH